MFTSWYLDPFAPRSLSRKNQRSRQLWQLFDQLAGFDDVRIFAGENAFEINESDEEYQLTLAAPGLAPEDVQVELHGQRLSVRAERKLSVPEGYTAHRRERESWQIAQSFALPTQVDAERVQAKLQDGVLRVTVGKSKQSQPRSIEVQ